MKKIQMTLIQIDNYGPWTVTPEPHLEADLQWLQATLLADLEKQFKAKGGLVFHTRFDNMLAVSNGLTLQDHERIIREINSNYPITISMGVGASEKPYGAQLLATRALQHAGGSRTPNRRGVLAGSGLSPEDENLVRIAHLDVNGVTSLTDEKPIYDTHLLLQQAYLMLMKFFTSKGALVFYMGGDNFIAPFNGTRVEELSNVLDELEQKLGVDLKVGVGSGPTAEVAARMASMKLHEIREGKVKKRIAF
jgi:GTP cyclohydrolase IIa